MAFTDTQKKALKAKLNHRAVKTREADGATLSYVEGWHVIAEANRIFGFDSWDRQTMSPQCVWSELQRGQTACFYSTKVRITVRAGDTVTVREGIGTGFGRSAQRDLAHDIALKAAETDATKRALATFGNPFGLALYDREQAQVRKPRAAKGTADPKPDTLVLRCPNDRRVVYGEMSDFVAGFRREAEALPTVDAIYNFWTANIEVLTELKRRSVDSGEDPVDGIVAFLKERLRAAGGVSMMPAVDVEAADSATSSMLRPKERRIRDKGHLAFVAGQPCLVCGRRPVQAHHLRFAQPRAMGLKVSDEYTVPLCNGHHDELHRTGDERAWWARHGIIDPLKFAGRLWAASRAAGATSIDDNEPVIAEAERRSAHPHETDLDLGDPSVKA